MESRNDTQPGNNGNQPNARRTSFIKNDAVEGGEETEVAAQIILPAEGRWALVVLVASFSCLFVVDGCAFSYGPLLPNICKSLQIDTTLGALVGAIRLSVYFMFSPISSALINRFGFRTSCMIGSVISCIGLFTSVFSRNVTSLITFLGFITGVGVSIASMSASLIVGFYFEKRRALALAISTAGSSVGIIVMYQVNDILVKSTGWQNTILMQSGLHGLLYFFGLVFRPLLSLTITETDEGGNPTRTVTVLPTISTDPGKSSEEQGKATATEKLLHAVSSRRFPTASAFFQESATLTQEGSPSTSTEKPHGLLKITLQTQAVVNESQMEQLKSVVSEIQIQNGKTTTNPEITVCVKKAAPKSFFGRLFHWRPHTPETRPMYRDDAFYEGEVKNLPIYRQSVGKLKENKKTSLKYLLAVTRAIRVEDLKQRRGICTISLRRVLVSMMDPALLKRKSVLLVCFSGFCTFGGVFVPYVFLQDRNSEAGLDQRHCSLLVSVISFSSLAGRLVFGILTNYMDSCHLMALGLLVAGISTTLSNLSFSLVYQYAYSLVYGAFISVVPGCRSIVLVKLYGLENLTNVTGILLMFIGIGNIISTPLAAFLKDRFGYKHAFYVAGGFIILSGVAYLPVNALNTNENKTKPNE